MQKANRIKDMQSFGADSRMLRARIGTTLFRNFVSPELFRCESVLNITNLFSEREPSLARSGTPIADGAEQNEAKWQCEILNTRESSPEFFCCESVLDISSPSYEREPSWIEVKLR